MLGQVLSFLRRRLDADLQAKGEPTREIVVFVDELSPLRFTPDTITLLLVNLREERTLRAGDRYRQATANGGSRTSLPDIRLQLKLLFAASFQSYEESWNQVSRVIEHFQRTPVYTRESMPDMPAGIEKMVFELDLENLNQVWGALRINYHPSVAYKTSLVIIRDEQGETATPVRQIESEIGGTA